MSLSDPLGDMLTRIRNAQRARQTRCVAPASRLRTDVLEVLKREGFIYNSHGEADHLPYWERDADGGSVMLNLPFHYAIDDAMYFNFAWLASKSEAQRLADPDRVFEIFWAAFWHQYRQGGYLNICLHPFISGRALRTAMLDRLITRMKGLPGVWFPTCEQVARWCYEKFPPKAA